ncbi:hypothetical protein JCM8202v2_003511 [Rhodotorula sphaerocarpa]
MAIRRPPTAVSLKPSDVIDLQAFLKRRDLQQQQQQAHSTQPGGAGAGAGSDELLRREQQAREERERKGQRGRVLGA